MVKKNSIEALINEALAGMLSILNDDEKRLITENFHIQTFKKNEMIYNEGEKAELLMCLIKGKVKIFKAGIGGRCQIMRLIRPIQYFGYRAYFAGEDYITAASAFENATIGFLPMPLIESLVKQNNRLAYFFIKELAMDLGMSDTRTVNLTQKHMRGRLAESLIALRNKYGYEDDGSTLSIYLSREELANMSNMTTSNAIRILSSLTSENIIITDGRKIKVIDEQKLLQISENGG